MNTKHTDRSGKRVDMKSFGKALFLLGFCLSIAVGASAQYDDPDTPVPFDGGITLLVAAGTAYGIKQWKQSRKENKDSEIPE